MTVDGGRSKLILNDQSLGPAATPTTSTDAK
jgi:hypothetical protein